jgi:indole-3-glycerol phosphate synthase
LRFFRKCELGVGAVAVVLDRIVAHKQKEIGRLKGAVSLDQLERAAAGAPRARDFIKALEDGGRPAIIAEIKRASPSAGLIRPHLDVGAIAAGYERGGAAAISVITEEHFFQGGLHYLKEAREVVSLPLLCKDFIVDPIQVLTARSAGADAILLIIAILEQQSLADLMKLAHSLGMACLVEAHDERDLLRAVATEARVIGINNRDLRTFEVTLDTTLRLRDLVPLDRLLVSESGIEQRSDLETLHAAGVRAVLVGTSLMRAGNPEEKLRELRGVP